MQHLINNIKNSTLKKELTDKIEFHRKLQARINKSKSPTNKEADKAPAINSDHHKNLVEY